MSLRMARRKEIPTVGDDLDKSTRKNLEERNTKFVSACRSTFFSPKCLRNERTELGGTTELERSCEPSFSQVVVGDEEKSYRRRCSKYLFYQTNFLLRFPGILRLFQDEAVMGK